MKVRTYNFLEINGSPHGLKGNTSKIVDLILKTAKTEVEELGYNLSIQRIELCRLDLKYCIGCWNCFREGSCSLNKLDNMGNLEKMLLEANAIIFSSPVHFHNVSALMKNFLDRIARWTHIFKLRNKYGIAVASTADTGLNETLEYLELAIRALGMWFVGKVGGQYFTHPNPSIELSPLEKFLQYLLLIKTKRSAKKKGKNLIKMMQGRAGHPDETDFHFFKVMKKKTTYGKRFLPYDRKYWKAMQWYKLKHFSEH